MGAPRDPAERERWRSNVADAVRRRWTSPEYRARISAAHTRPQCGRGHEMTPDNVYVNPKGGNRHCRECMRIRDRARHIRDREKRNAYARKRHHKMTPEQRRAAQLIYRMGITPAKYAEILERQSGRCAICRSIEPGGRWRSVFAVDHDHRCCPGKRSCGKCVRGLLCGPCNIMLGNAHDSVPTLEAAIAYLRGFEGS